MTAFFQAFMNASAQANCAASVCPSADFSNIALILDASLLASIIILPLFLLGLHNDLYRIPE